MYARYKAKTDSVGREGGRPATRVPLGAFVTPIGRRAPELASDPGIVGLDLRCGVRGAIYCGLAAR